MERTQVVEEGQLSFTHSWDTELEEQDPAGYGGEGGKRGGTEQRRGAQREGRQRRAAQGSGGQPKLGQVLGMTDAPAPAAQRLGRAGQRASCMVLRTKGSTRTCV